MAQQHISNDLEITTLPKVEANFTDLYAQVAALNGGSAAPAALNGNTITSQGTFVANGATPVTVADAAITANSAILIALKTVGGTVGAQPTVETKTAGTGFTVAATASDTSTYTYIVFN